MSEESRWEKAKQQYLDRVTRNDEEHDEEHPEPENRIERENEARFQMYKDEE